MNIAISSMIYAILNKARLYSIPVMATVLRVSQYKRRRVDGPPARYAVPFRRSSRPVNSNVYKPNPSVPDSVLVILQDVQINTTSVTANGCVFNNPTGCLPPSETLIAFSLKTVHELCRYIQTPLTQLSDFAYVDWGDLWFSCRVSMDGTWTDPDPQSEYADDRCYSFMLLFDPEDRERLCVLTWLYDQLPILTQGVEPDCNWSNSITRLIHAYLYPY